MIEEAGPWGIALAAGRLRQLAWIRVTHRDIVITPAGGQGIYGTVHFKNLAVGILPIDAEQNTFLIGQYRLPLKAHGWEIPEGGGAIGVDPLKSAARELAETVIVHGHWRN